MLIVVVRHLPALFWFCCRVSGVIKIDCISVQFCRRHNATAITAGVVKLWIWVIKANFLIMLQMYQPNALFLFYPQKTFQFSQKPKTMGTCPTRCQSNMTILESPDELTGRFNPRTEMCKINQKEKNRIEHLFRSLCRQPGNRDRLACGLPIIWKYRTDHVHWGKTPYHIRVCTTAPLNVSA